MTIKKNKRINPKNLLDLGNWCLQQVMRPFWRLYDACCCINQQPEVWCDANRTWFISVHGKIGYIDYDSGELCFAYKGIIANKRFYGDKGVSYYTGGTDGADTDIYTFFRFANRTSKGIHDGIEDRTGNGGLTQSIHGVLFYKGKVIYDGRAIGIQYCGNSALIRIDEDKGLVVTNGKIVGKNTIDDKTGEIIIDKKPTCHPITGLARYASIGCCQNMFYIVSGDRVVIFGKDNTIIYDELTTAAYVLCNSAGTAPANRISCVGAYLIVADQLETGASQTYSVFFNGSPLLYHKPLYVRASGGSYPCQYTPLVFSASGDPNHYIFLARTNADSGEIERLLFIEDELISVDPYDSLYGRTLFGTTAMPTLADRLVWTNRKWFDLITRKLIAVDSEDDLWTPVTVTVKSEKPLAGSHDVRTGARWDTGYDTEYRDYRCKKVRLATLMSFRTPDDAPNNTEHRFNVGQYQLVDRRGGGSYIYVGHDVVDYIDRNEPYEDRLNKLRAIGIYLPESLKIREPSDDPENAEGYTETEIPDVEYMDENVGKGLYDDFPLNIYITYKSDILWGFFSVNMIDRSSFKSSTGTTLISNNSHQFRYGQYSSVHLVLLHVHEQFVWEDKEWFVVYYPTQACNSAGLWLVLDGITPVDYHSGYCICENSNNGLLQYVASYVDHNGWWLNWGGGGELRSWLYFERICAGKQYISKT